MKKIILILLIVYSAFCSAADQDESSTYYTQTINRIAQEDSDGIIPPPNGLSYSQLKNRLQNYRDSLSSLGFRPDDECQKACPSMWEKYAQDRYAKCKKSFSSETSEAEINRLKNDFKIALIRCKKIDALRKRIVEQRPWYRKTSSFLKSYAKALHNHSSHFYWNYPLPYLCISSILEGITIGAALKLCAQRSWKECIAGSLVAAAYRGWYHSIIYYMTAPLYTEKRIPFPSYKRKDPIHPALKLSMRSTIALWPLVKETLMLAGVTQAINTVLCPDIKTTGKIFLKTYTLPILAQFISLPLSILAHELGHGIVNEYFTKKPFTVYLGGLNGKDCSIKLLNGRIRLGNPLLPCGFFAPINRPIQASSRACVDAAGAIAGYFASIAFNGLLSLVAQRSLLKNNYRQAFTTAFRSALNPINILSFIGLNQLDNIFNPYFSRDIGILSDSAYICLDIGISL
ncbi:MAG: hypothetical protein UV38_C0002G0136 [candidate division TM6 bacterium GW2011_GWE2_42_60]|nr:MAG: hypothetical protein UV38_C0002G0136 [candidate division TM6 bacterium GW2011_GWE2_42_60]HBY06107.1 hypothetical protein [Candidatus Dependentiae bacterium]